MTFLNYISVGLALSDESVELSCNHWNQKEQTLIKQLLIYIIYIQYIET